MITNAEKVISLQLEAQLSLTWANWWINSATNGTAELRNIERGDSSTETGWRKLSSEELKQEAMNTAKNHIHRAHEISELIKGLVNK